MSERIDVNEIWDEVKKAAGKAEKKTNELIDRSKIKISIMNVNSEIKQKYQKLGEIVYYNKNNKIDDEDIIRICIAELDGLHIKLENLKKKANEAAKLKTCPNCGKANGKDASYCSKCGSEF